MLPLPLILNLEPARVFHRASATGPGGSFFAVSVIIPASTLAGDFLLLTATNPGTTFPLAADDDTGGNLWTLLAQSDFTVLFWKRATANSAGKTVTIGPFDAGCCAVLSVFGNASQSDPPFEAASFAGNLAGDTSHPSIVTSGPERMVILGHNHSDAVEVSSQSATNPATLTEFIEQVDGSSLVSATIAGALRLTAGATGDFSWVRSPTGPFSGSSFALAILPRGVNAALIEETATANDLVDLASALAATIAETATANDLVSLNVTGAIAVDESAEAQDSLYALLGALTSIAESAEALDSLSASLGLALSIEASAEALDSLYALLGLALSIGASAEALDSLYARLEALASIEETAEAIYVALLGNILPSVCVATRTINNCESSGEAIDSITADTQAIDFTEARVEAIGNTLVPASSIGNVTTGTQAEIC